MAKSGALANVRDILNKHYFQQMKSRTTSCVIGDHVEITWPFLDRHGGDVQFYVRPGKSGYLITDYSCTLEDLGLSGFDLEDKEKMKIVEEVLNGYGVKLRGRELYLEVSAVELPQALHSFLQAILALQGMGRWLPD